MDYNMEGISELYDPIVILLWEINYCIRNERRSVDLYKASGMEEGWNRRQLGIKAIAQREVHLALTELGLAPYQIPDRQRVFTFTEWENIFKAGEGSGEWKHMEKTFLYFKEFEERVYNNKLRQLTIPRPTNDAIEMERQREMHFSGEED